MKTVVEMAREAGLVGGPVYARGLERFAELVRAAAIKESPDYLMGYADGVHVEREACAQFLMSTNLAGLPEDTALHYARLLKGFAEGIRARSNL